MGAGGKMGQRLTDNLKTTDHDVRHVEVSEAGKAALRERGIETVSAEQALDGAEVVILAIPDNLIGTVTSELDPHFQAGQVLMCLDPAAPYAGKLPERDDLTYFVTHPCHPNIFKDADDADPAALRDFFGGIAGKQAIVCALMQGPEAHYALGEEIACTIFQPVSRSHRITVEQMAILEPPLSETVGATLVSALREATDEAVRRGVPAAAARDFMLGHLTIELAILFEELEGAQFSDGALKAIEQAKPHILQPDWLKVFEPENIRKSIQDITNPQA
ncbi:MAG: phosphogluconate dehydrogenase C-terminal domain-containing protein [Halofilum sp. (in: g-proteobacteria)]|nr:phosphogluconate dehydrogenase C-terminal domain-containing protein [Halofilum sp. (in: g-proteobacteria)]